MRGYEKEIIASQLKDEKYVIRQLKLLYSKSLQQIDGKIEELLAKYDATQLQSVIYQLDHQKALKQQISGILDTLQADEYETISDYLTKCYENGFMGSMYSMNKQGVPLIIPFDQEQVINAIVHDSKISKGLYEALGFNMKDLKKRISAEVSRGIANGMSYQEIARNLRNTSGIGINNATRIARTEGHRIQAQSQLDACNHAKKKGADVVKQWDATLDGRTRPHHRKLDGQIREIDDYFEVDGRKAKAPGQFGRPNEDINCRCVILQRARWGLDEEELKTLEERAEFYGLDKTEDFEEFKEKYLKAIKEEAQEVAVKIPRYETYDIKKITSTYKGNDNLVKEAFAQAQMDEDTLTILNNIEKLKGVEIKRGKKAHFQAGYNELTISNSKDLGTFYHEFGHSLDNLTAYYDSWDELGHKYTWISEGLTEIRTNIVQQWEYKIPTKFTSIFESEQTRLVELVKQNYVANGKLNDELKAIIQKKYGSNLGTIPASMQRNILRQEQEKLIQKYLKEVQLTDTGYKRWGCLSDILDALTSGSARNVKSLLSGHGWDYYNGGGTAIQLTTAGMVKKQNTEIFANFVEMKLGGYTEQLKMLREELPDLYNELESEYKKIASILGG